MPITLAFANMKGGVGKTTSCVSIGGALAAAGRRTLLVDIDPQASLTRQLLGSARTDQLSPEATVAALFDESQVVPLERIVVQTPLPNLWLLPGSDRIEELNGLGPAECGMRQFALCDLVGSDLAAGFDRILIDCMPSLLFLTRTALTASDFVLTPLQADGYGAQSIKTMSKAVASVRTANPRLMILGYLRTVHFPKTAIHQSYSDRFKRDFPSLLFDSFIPHATQFKEAIDALQPITSYKPRSAAAKAVVAVVAEMEGRIARLQQPDNTHREVA